MNAVERRSVGALAAIYASRMLGMFLLLPVLALYARSLPDYSPVLLGLAMGAYGLTQALLQIPFGRWSDRYGRKPLITLGLAFYAVGSLLGVFAQSVVLLAIARAVQGAGAVSASVTALMADLTRSEVRTRAMAVIGISIGLSFVLALIAAPALDAAIGVPGIFGVMLAMALLGVALLHFAVPREPARHGGAEGRKLSGLLETRAATAAAAAVFRHVRAARDHDRDVPVGAAGAAGRSRPAERRTLAGLPGRVRGLDRRHGAARAHHGAQRAGRGRGPARAVGRAGGPVAGHPGPRPRPPVGGAGVP